MVSFTFLSAFAAATLLSIASAQTATQSEASSTVVSIGQPSQTVSVNTPKDVGCFNSSAPLEDHGFYIGQSPGNCQLVCAWLKMPVMALSEGTNCWCGMLIPDKNTKVANSSCNTPCKGINTNLCGGPGKLWVVLTKTTDNEIENYVPPVVVSSSSSSTIMPVAQSTDSPKTITEIPTNTPSSTPDAGSGGGSNKVAIAVGVVIGVVVLLAVIGGVFFFLRHKRRREVEEEFRRQANINSFAAGGKLHTSNSSMTDSRLDPEFMARRASNGSIADNEDYSRRILKVTNA